MRTSNSIKLAISLGLGLAFCLPALAAPKTGERRTETDKAISRGTNGAQSGYWINLTRRVYEYTESEQSLAVENLFQAIYGRQPNDTEKAQWWAALGSIPTATINAYQSQLLALFQRYYGRKPTLDELATALKRLAAGTPIATIENELKSNLTARMDAAGLGSVDPSIASAIRDRILSGAISIDAAIPQIQALAALAQQNKNSNYPNNLPSAFLTSTGYISADVANQVGAWGRGVGVDTKIANAYRALGIDPYSKRMPDGQQLSTNFNTMISQLQAANMITYDWDFNSLMNDLNRSVIDQMGSARAGIRNSQGWDGNQSNLFSKGNLHDPTLQHDYDAGLSSVETNDATVRSWIKTYDGLSAFNNTNDVDLFMAVTYSTAAKLDAQSKALRALGLTSQADTMLTEARNLVLLTGNNHDPLVLDLNHNGKIDVTGLSSAKGRSDANNRFVKDGSVKFDLFANGQPLQIEWIKGGDGFLIDNRKNAAIAAVASGQNLTGAHLFGDVDGYPGGFLKLGMGFDKEAKFAANAKIQLSPEFGSLKGDELNNLMVWVDNGDGVATRNELRSLKDLGITEISVRPVYKKDNGELLEQAYFVQNGQKYIIQEVWFRSEK